MPPFPRPSVSDVSTSAGWYESVGDVTARAREAGATTDGPTETGWNTRELAVRDPDGYELVFSEPVDTDRSFASMMGSDDEE